MPLAKLVSIVIKTIAKNKRASNWRYKDLEDTPWLYDSSYLKKLAEDAIKYKDKESLSYIPKYIKRFDCGDIASYKAVLRKIAKYIDISDFF